MSETKDTLRCFTVKEAAERLSIHWATAYELVRTGALRAIHIGRAVRIPEDALAEFLYNQSTKKPEPENAPKRRIVTKIV